jgi:ABC-type multidrug transport system ATPase subunit
MVNGFKKEAAAFARVMGYCEQFDVHSPGLTIAESVRLSAALRLAPHVCDADVRPGRHFCIALLHSPAALLRM